MNLSEIGEYYDESDHLFMIAVLLDRLKEVEGIRSRCDEHTGAGAVLDMVDEALEIEE